MTDTSIRDAEPNDIYVDASGKLWRVVGVCREPTIQVEEVEGQIHDPNAAFQGVMAVGVAQGLHSGPRASITKIRRSGGIGGLMWDGFVRIFRPSGAQP